MSSSVHSPRDHGEESLPLPPGREQNVEQTYDKLFDQIVREQFVSTCEPHLGVFLREKELASVKEVAKAADLYLDARKYSNYKVQSRDKVRSTQAKPGSSAKPYSFDKPWSTHVNGNNKNETN